MQKMPNIVEPRNRFSRPSSKKASVDTNLIFVSSDHYHKLAACPDNNIIISPFSNPFSSPL